MLRRLSWVSRGVGIRNTSVRSLDATSTDGFEDTRVVRHPWRRGMGCRTIPSIQPKTVVVAAIPSAKVSTATAVRDGGPAEDAPAAYRRSSKTPRMGLDF